MSECQVEGTKINSFSSNGEGGLAKKAPQVFFIKSRKQLKKPWFLEGFQTFLCIILASIKCL